MIKYLNNITITIMYGNYKNIILDMFNNNTNNHDMITLLIGRHRNIINKMIRIGYRDYASIILYIMYPEHKNIV